MPETAKVETKSAEPVVAAAALTLPAETAKVEATPLAAADAGKREGAPESKPEAKADGKAAPETKTESKPEVKAEGETKPAAESDGKKPPTEGETKPEVKAEEKKPEAEIKPEVKPEAADKKEAPPLEVKAPPVYDALKLPENVKLDDARVKKFDELLGKTELAGKADHAAMTALRQDLANFYIEEVNRIGNQVTQHQRDVWNRLIEQRFNELKSDPQLGGNRIETTLGNAKYALESLLPSVSEGSQAPFTKKDASDLIGIMDAGGVSHSKLMIKALNAIYELLREPEPVNPNLPSERSGPKEAGQRGWYNTVEGVKVA